MAERRSGRGKRWRVPASPASPASAPGAPDAPGPPVADAVPPSLFDERWRMLRAGVAADRRNHGARVRRRALIPAAVASGVLAGTGLLSAWAASTTPVSTVSSPTAPPASAPNRAEIAALAQLRKTLNADRTAIAALPKVIPPTSTASSGTTTPGGAPSAPAQTAAASVPALPPLPSISVAAPTPPPATQGTTGASGLP